MKKFKNNKTEVDTWVGMMIEPSAYYEIEDRELFRWQNNSKVLSDIASGNGIINNGSEDIVDIAKAINFLKDSDSSPRDSDGSPLQRAKVTNTGWHLQLHGIEFETSKLSSERSKKPDNTDFGFLSMKFYKLVEGVETIISGADLNQEFLDSNCVKTIVEWEPTHDIEVVGGFLKQIVIPSEDIRTWVVAAPDVPAVYGGSKPFCVNINLRYLGLEDGLRVDGRASKSMTYSAIYHTTKLQLIFRHPAGFKHSLHMIFEIFKP
jgi:hypothetical protein